MAHEIPQRACLLRRSPLGMQRSRAKELGHEARQIREVPLARLFVRFGSIPKSCVLRLDRRGSCSTFIVDQETPRVLGGHGFHSDR